MVPKTYLAGLIFFLIIVILKTSTAIDIIIKVCSHNKSVLYYNNNSLTVLLYKFSYILRLDIIYITRQKPYLSLTCKLIPHC